jgi:hypothetical protein
VNARMIVAAAVIVTMPALAQAQVSCASCGHGHSVIRPASAELWAGYEQSPDCGGCGHCRRCCDPCCTPLLCVVPNTLRRIGRALDCLLPCGPRSGHGCGISCIGAGSGCTPGACGRPGIFCPNKCCDLGCGEVAPPMYRGPAGGEPIPPAPQPAQETRHAPASAPYAQANERQLTAGSVALSSKARASAARQMPSARPIGNGVSTAEHVAPVVNKQPVSVLKRISYDEEIETPAVRTNWPKAMDSIPHNPLR